MNRASFGMKMFRREALCLLIMVLSVLYFTRFGIDGRARSQAYILEKKLLVLMDSSSLNCSLCLQSLTEFIGVINANRLEDSVLGVMIMDKRKEEEDLERHRKIAEKRLKGFVSGNNIQFPFLLDVEGIFRPFIKDASATLIVLNSQNKTVEKYEFPLSKSQLSSIIN